MESIKDFWGGWNLLEFVIAGLIGAVIAKLFELFISFFRMKRKKYCISKCLISSSVYRNTDEDGLKITVTYNNKVVGEPLTVIYIRMRNDGSEDLMYSQRVNLLQMCLEGLSVLDVSVFSKTEGVNPSVIPVEDGKYELKWDLLKCDESFVIKVVLMGEMKDISAVKFDIRAEGINQIKSPEYRVRDVMLPVLVGGAIAIIPFMVFMPEPESNGDFVPLKPLLLICWAFMVLIVWIVALSKRIKWLKEQ